MPLLQCLLKVEKFELVSCSCINCPRLIESQNCLHMGFWRVSMCADDPKILKGKMASSLNIFIEQLMRNRSSSLPFIYFDLVVGNMMYVFG